jgi:hypothetical protein
MPRIQSLDYEPRQDPVARRLADRRSSALYKDEATGLRTGKNVLRLIDPAILEQALHNNAAPAAARESAD